MPNVGISEQYVNDRNHKFSGLFSSVDRGQLSWKSNSMHISFAFYICGEVECFVSVSSLSNPVVCLFTLFLFLFGSSFSVASCGSFIGCAWTLVAYAASSCGAQTPEHVGFSSGAYGHCSWGAVGLVTMQHVGLSF